LTHPLTRLVARYGKEHGHYLFGELCLLEYLGLDAFLMRHTEQQVRTITEELGAVGLWLEPGESVWTVRHIAAERGLDQTAASLVDPPLRLGLGSELLRECLKWASSVGLEHSEIGQWFESTRIKLSEGLGFPLPPLIVTLDPLRNHSLGYTLYARSQVLCRGEAFPGQVCILRDEDTDQPAGFPYDWLRDPASRGFICWMPIETAIKPPAELTRLQWLQALRRHLESCLLAHAHLFFGSKQMDLLLADAQNAGYDHELERYVSRTELRFVFCALLQQGISLKPTQALLEAVLTHILRDLTTRKLNYGEIERAHRQLPLYATDTLVAVIRRHFGLGADPVLMQRQADVAPPLMAWTPTPAQRQAWLDCLALMTRNRPVIDFWYGLSQAQALPWHGFANAEAACAIWCHLERLLSEVAKHLNGDTVVRSEALVRLVIDTDWMTLQWQLLYPARLLYTHQLTAIFKKWLQQHVGSDSLRKKA
jgi:hypothetical protein